MVSGIQSPAEGEVGESNFGAHHTTMENSTVVGDDIYAALLLPVGPETLIPSPNCNYFVDFHSQIQLVVWRVSGRTSELETFQKKQLSSYCPHGERRPTATTILPGRSGINGAKAETCICPLSSNVESVLALLTRQFQEGKQYQSLNCYRSALSSTHLPVEGFPVENHPLVRRLLEGVFNLRPPQPHYRVMWNVSQLLLHIKS